MSRTYKNYYVLVPIKTLVNLPTTPENQQDNTLLNYDIGSKLDDKVTILKDTVPKVMTGEIYFGSRFVTTLLDAEGVKEALEIVSEDDVYKIPEGCDNPITAIKLSTQSDAIKIGVFSIYSITLVPADPEHTIPPYNTKYVCRIPASGNLDPRKVGLS